jgi:predicted phosphodiesterase
MSKHELEMKYEAIRMWYNELYPQSKIAQLTGINERTIRKLIKDESMVKAVLGDVDFDIVKENVRLAKKVQTQADKNNIQNKSFREYARIDSSVEESNKALIEVFSQKKLTLEPIVRTTTQGKSVLVVQLSDLHFNEIISGLAGNHFDTEVAAKRVALHVSKSIKIGKALGAESCLLAMTGDLLNSPRRVSEITEAATSRANAIFVAVDIIQQAIIELRSHFNVTVASIAGNESRFAEYVDWTDFLASDSADCVIHNALSLLFKDDTNVQFVPMTSPLETVVEVAGKHILLIHGNGHGFAARTGNLESAYQKLKAKYAGLGVKIDFMLCGHIHSAYVSDWFARSSGLPGNNHYSEKSLGLDGRASQNCLVVHSDGNIDVFKNDLQNVAGVTGYNFDKVAATLGYQLKKADKGNVLIQKVIV